MIFGDNYKKLLIFQSNDIWRYRATFNDISRYIMAEAQTLETRKFLSKLAGIQRG